MTPVLQFKNVSRSYTKGISVLNDVSLSIAKEEVVGLIGRNGAGKTTLIRIAMGMLYPHGGSVRVFGLSPTEDPIGVKKRVGYVAEDQVLPPGSSIRELIAFHRYLFPQWDGALERQLLDRFSLPIGSRIKHLSKGQAREAALLCAVCHRPELLILDEPVVLENGKVRLDRDLDRLRENICLAMIPRTSAPDATTIEKAAACLRVRLVHGDWHAIVEGTPEMVHERLKQSLGVNGIHCVRVPLEELFIELLGDDR